MSVSNRFFFIIIHQGILKKHALPFPQISQILLSYIKQQNCFNIENNKECFLSTKSELEWFLKDHVTLKTAEISALFPGINNILKCIIIKNGEF